MLDPYECPFCEGRIFRSRISPRMVCGDCQWQFIPPLRGDIAPDQVEDAWEAARRGLS